MKARDRHSVAVVGSRRSTHYGDTCARKISFQLASAGITIASGLACGIDTAAHEGALEAKGRTLAVIICGLGKLYPPENHDLARRIADGHGAVLSAFPATQILVLPRAQSRLRIVASPSERLFWIWQTPLSE